MKDKNGIDIKCENCDDFIPAGTNGRGCALYAEDCENVFGEKRCIFKASSEALEARIKELQDELYADKYNYESWEEIKAEHQKLEATILKLQKELNIVQESERVEAQEADRLRAEVKELEKKLTETIKLLSERSRECGELEAHNEVLQRRIREFSMELLDRTMKENKDVLERLKQAESEER